MISYVRPESYDFTVFFEGALVDEGLADKANEAIASEDDSTVERLCPIALQTDTKPHKKEVL
jgi:hypothetical protein